MAATGLAAKGIGASMVGWALQPLTQAKAKLIGAKVIGSNVHEHESTGKISDLESKIINAVLNRLASEGEGEAGIKGIGSRIHLPLPLVNLLSHDAKAH